MFWGLIMEPGRRYSQKVDTAFHLTMAALDIQESSNTPAQVMCTYEGRTYLLCTLRKPDLLQCPLDLEFSVDSEISFAANGNAHVHLTGYIADSDEGGLSVADLEEQEEEEEEEETGKVNEKKKHKKKKIVEGRKSKKIKLENGSFNEEEEESDDPDYEEPEGEENDSNESGEGESEEEEEEDDSDDGDEEVENSAEDEEPPVVETKASKKEKKASKQNGDVKEKKPEKKQNKGPRNAGKGVMIEDIKEGTGQVAKAGRMIHVYYEGRLQKNNKKFDSLDRGNGFKFRVGAGEVIKGWDIGVIGMKVGGKRKIICPPHVAYGSKGSPPTIPPGATLDFVVELKKVQ